MRRRRGDADNPFEVVTYVFGMEKRETGAGEGIRTLDPNLGKVVLYP